MIINKINSENYEAFYLDYLEGNLEQNDVLELFAFLNEHPEFRVDEELVMLTPDDNLLGDDFKNLLKTDMLSQDISLNNVDFFLLAQKEGQLTEVQNTNLAQFLELYPEFKLDQKLYALSSLEADQKIVYPAKGQLKQRAPIVLWPYYSALAAACAVLFFWLMPNPGNVDADSVARDLKHKTRTIQRNFAVENVDEVNEDDEKDQNQDVTRKKVDLRNTPEKSELLNKKEAIANNNEQIKPSERVIKIKTIDEQPLEKNLAEVLPTEKKKGTNEDVITAQTAGFGMSFKEVAPPVTRKLSEIIKTEVNLKKGEDAKGERKGVFFKVGNFEFYRNKRIKE
jgi:hypothetical protein